MKKKNTKNTDWEKAYDELYKEFKHANHAKARIRLLYNQKQRENNKIKARNRYLMTQLKGIRTRIDKILKIEGKEGGR